MPVVYVQGPFNPSIARFGTIKPIHRLPDLPEAVSELALSRPNDCLSVSTEAPSNVIYVALWLAMHGSVRLLVRTTDGEYVPLCIDNAALRMLIEQEASRFEAPHA